MKLYDSHCHLDMEPLSTEAEAVIERAFKSGVTGMINIGVSLTRSAASVKIADSYPNIWAAVGIHPQDGGEIIDIPTAIEDLKNLATGDKVVAIGEIGLDYYSAGTGQKGMVAEADRLNQTKILEAQLALAKELKLPVVLHIRDAFEDMLAILKKSSFQQSELGYAPGVIHCFTGTPKEAQKFLDLGFYIGFTGLITFEQAKFDHIREAVKNVPLDRILVETDAPFLAPEPYRGKTNEPAYVVEVARKVAEIKKLEYDAVAEATAKNTEALFL